MAQDLKNQCPDYGLEQTLAKQIKAREAKEKLAHLADPQGSGLGRQTEEKHYFFWLHAQEGQKPEPSLQIVAKDHRKVEQPVLLLADYAQRREVAERQA